jgi:hypothetical protein
MRKYNYNSNYSYRNKPRSWLQLSLLAIAVGLPLLLLLTELAVRGIVGLTGYESKLNGLADTSIAQTYGLRLVNTSKPAQAKLIVRQNPLLGYELLPKQKNKYWQINEQGFRSDRPISRTKASDEVRLFLIGNSTAFGQLATSNSKTIAPQLEKLLAQRLESQTNQPEKFKPLVLPYFADQVEQIKKLPPRLKEGRYQVITAAVPGYNSGNELSMVAHKLMAFQPDGIILLNGYEDLRSPSQELGKQVSPPSTADPTDQYRNFFGFQIQTWFNQLMTVRLVRSWVSASPNLPIEQSFETDQFSGDPKELERRVQRYKYNLQQISNLGISNQGTKIPLILALQPEITGKQTNLSPTEQQILKQLNQGYRTRLENGYQALAQTLSQNSAKIKFLDLYRALDGNPQPSFLDPIHLTESANQAIAQRLFESLEQTFALQPVPPT